MSNTTSHLEHLLTNPPAEYYPVPWWGWFGHLTPEKIQSHIKLMFDQGLREFFIFPAYGMETEFLSEDYFRDIEFTVNECRKLGMKVWIYDEFNWPSGMAGGRVPRLHPEAIGTEIRVHKFPSMPKSELADQLADPCVLHAVVVQPGGKVAPVDMATYQPSDVAIYRAERDNCVSITSYGSLWCIHERGMLNMLSKSAVRKFIDEAYEPFAKRFPNDIGKTIKGFFTDEPCMGLWGPLPWTDDFTSRFRDRYGYDLLPRLHDLTFEAPGFERTRAHYWALVSDMTADAYMGQIADWCEERGMLVTGHLSFEEGSISIWCHGDTPRVMSRMHAPGCDLLGLKNSYDRGRELEEYRVITAKVTSSTARAAGRKRVMCESFGVAPYWRTMADEKRMTDWLCAMGINMINDNTLVADISSFRKRGTSGKHFTQPYWQHEQVYYDYAARTSALMAETTLNTELAVVYPSATWHSLVERLDPPCPRLNQYEKALVKTMNALVFKHWDFEFLFEDALASARIEDGALITDYGTFKSIVVAGVSLMPAASAAKLKEFAEAGGTVITVGSDPAAFDDTSVSDLSLPGAIDLPDWNSDAFEAEIDSVLRKRASRPWSINGIGAEDVISAARTDATGAKLLFVANMNPGDKTLNITWAGNSPVECWDAARAERWTPAQQPGSLMFNLPQDESVWFVQAAGAAAGRVPAQFAASSAPLIELSGDWDFSIEPANILGLQLKLKTDPDGTLDPLTLKPDETWVDVNEGDAGIPLRPEEMKCYWLHSEFDLTAPISDLQLGVDSSEIEAAWINGEKLGDNRQFTIWDDENRVWDLPPLLPGEGRGEVTPLRIGRNSVLIRVKPSPYYAKGLMEIPLEHYPLAALPITITFTEPVVLRGSFAAEQIDGVGKLTPPPAVISAGDWRGKGYPTFAGTGIYKKTFTWDGPAGDVLISLDSGRDIAEVRLDGRSLGKRAWGPRRFRGNITSGEHTIEVRVSNNLGNFLRRAYDVSNPIAPVPAGLMSSVTVSALS